MVFEDYRTKKSLVLVFTGEGKGKTSASLGLMCRALGAGFKVAYIQFIKRWQVNEHTFINKIQPLYKNKLIFFQGGAGFYKAGELSAKNVTKRQHRQIAFETYKKALKYTTDGKFELVICDEINNAVNDGLLDKKLLVDLIKSRHPNTSLCLTGRDFPPDLIKMVDIATDMTKLKHHFDDKYLANKGIDY